MEISPVLALHESTSVGLFEAMKLYGGVPTDKGIASLKVWYVLPISEKKV